MRLVSTVALLLISICLGVAIVVVDREPVAASGPSSLSLTRFPAELVDQIEVQIAGVKDIVLEKSSETEAWTFSQPIEDRANSKTIESLLDSLNHLTIQDEIFKDEIGATQQLTAESLGLDGKNVIRVTMTAPRVAGGDERDDYVILIGNNAPQTNTLYARVIDDVRRPHVYVVSGNPRRYIQKPMITLRDRQLLETTSDSVVRVVMKTPRGPVELTRKITPPAIPWRITKPIEARADANLLEKILTEVNSISIVGVLKTGELPGPPPNPIPDGSVAMEIYSYGTTEPVTVYFTPSEKKPTPGPDGVIDESAQYLAASVSDRPAEFLVESDLLEDFPNSLVAFRDRHLANIPPQLVGQIFIKGLTDPLVRLERRVVNQRAVWQSVRNNERELANDEQIQKLLGRINSKLITDFTSDNGADLGGYGLQDPAVRVAFQIRNPAVSDPNAENAFVSRTLNLGYGDAAGETVFAKFDNEGFVYQIDPTFRVPTNPMKWKDLKVLNFNQFNLESIERDRLNFPDEGPIRLDYDFRKTANWTAYESNQLVSGALNLDIANDLMTDLGSLTAASWVTSRSSAYAALENPSAKFRVRLRERDAAANGTRSVVKTLTLAEGLSGYYGRIDDSPDVFILDGKMVRQLMRPLIGAVVRPE